MTRVEIETEIYFLMKLVDSTSTVNAEAPTRLFVQGKIQGAIDKITQEHKFAFRRKSFAVYLAAPLTGTLVGTVGAKTATVTGQTPDSTWNGCHVVCGQGFPMMIESFSGQVLTFVQPILTALSTTAFTVHFDAALFPTGCQTILKGS